MTWHSLFKSFLFSTIYLGILSFIYISKESRIHDYSLGCNIYSHLFLCSKCPRFGSSTRLFCPFDMSLHPLKMSLPFGTRCSRIILFFPSPRSRISYFSRKPCSFSWRVVFRNRDLGTGYTHCYSSVSISRCSQWIEQGIHVCKCTSIHRYLYMCEYTCAFISKDFHICLCM